MHVLAVHGVMAACSSKTRQSTLDAPTDDRVASTSAMLVAEGIAEATSVGIGADAEGEVLSEFGTLHLTGLRAMEASVTQLDATAAHDAKRQRPKTKQLTLDNFGGATLAEPMYAEASLQTPYRREEADADGDDEQVVGRGCGQVVVFSSSFPKTLQTI